MSDTAAEQPDYLMGLRQMTVEEAEPALMTMFNNLWAKIDVYKSEAASHLEALGVLAEIRDKLQTQIKASEVHVMKYHTCSSGEDCPLLP